MASTATSREIATPDNYLTPTNSSAMTRFKLGFRNRSTLEQLAICRRVGDCLCQLPESNRAAHARNPVETTVAAALTAHGEVEALRAQLRAALRRRDEKLRAARTAITRAAQTAFSATNGDPAALLALGLELEAAKRPVGQPAAPGQLRATPAEVEGVAKLRWKRPLRRCTFLVEMTRDPVAGGWKQVAISIRQSCEIPGLESGGKYWFRVAATNAHGQGPWSEVASVRVK
jgi:hypothetical protein